MENREGGRPRSGGVFIGFCVFVVVQGIILAAAGVKIPPILPERNSEHALAIDTLFYVILGITGFFFLLTEGLLVYFLLRYRARKGGRATHSHGSHALELAWTFIPGLILFSLAVFQSGTWGAVSYVSEMPDENDPDTVVVQVMGKQFEWHFRYPDENREFGTESNVTKLGELHVPVGRDVIVKLRTRDVLHSFWLPNSRVKQDLVPGQTIPRWFKITKPGRYEIVCAELCGIGHTRMRGILVAESEEQYAAWLGKMRDRQMEYGGHDPEKDKVWKYWRD